MGLEKRPATAGRKEHVGDDGLPKGSTLGSKLDAARAAAGLPTADEHEAAKDAPPPPRQVPLSACCIVLMLVASRASTSLVLSQLRLPITVFDTCLSNQTDVLDRSGGDGGDDAEHLRMISYGFTWMNLTGGMGALTFGILPGKVRWGTMVCCCSCCCGSWRCRSTNITTWGRAFCSAPAF